MPKSERMIRQGINDAELTALAALAMIETMARMDANAARLRYGAAPAFEWVARHEAAERLEEELKLREVVSK